MVNLSEIPTSVTTLSPEKTPLLLSPKMAAQIIFDRISQQPRDVRYILEIVNLFKADSSLASHMANRLLVQCFLIPWVENENLKSQAELQRALDNVYGFQLEQTENSAVEFVECLGLRMLALAGTHNTVN